MCSLPARHSVFPYPMQYPVLQALKKVYTKNILSIYLFLIKERRKTSVLRQEICQFPTQAEIEQLLCHLANINCRTHSVAIEY